MNKNEYLSIVKSEIDKSIDALIPYGAGTVTETRLRHVLDKIGEIAFREGQGYALGSLMTIEDAANLIGVSPRRMRAIAKDRHERFGVGYQIAGTNTWLFRPEEIESLRPGPEGYPAGRPRKA